jgi:hypothetical protein
MAEILEYTIVVMVSTLFVAGSVLVYDDYSSFESGLSSQVTLDAVSVLASRAIVNGSAAAAMSLPPTTLSCRDSVLSLKVGSSTLNESIPLGCNFTVAVPEGTHTVEFRTSASLLGVWVS